MKLSEFEKKNYLLKDKKDLIILSKIKQLEKNNLNKEDKKLSDW